MENFIFCAVIGFDNYEACIKQNNCICFFFHKLSDWRNLILLVSIPDKDRIWT